MATDAGILNRPGGKARPVLCVQVSEILACRRHGGRRGRGGGRSGGRRSCRCGWGHRCGRSCSLGGRRSDRRRSLGSCRSGDSALGTRNGRSRWLGGRRRWHCYAGCSVEEVLSTVGLNFSALFPPRALSTRRAPERQPFGAHEALRCLRSEAHIVVVAAAAMASGQELAPADRARLVKAVALIQEALPPSRWRGQR
jgi:hypothetical protein